jgi:hypothetical protein
MIKTLGKTVAKSIRDKRAQLAAMREEIEDLFDYLDILEARARDAGKPTHTTAEVRKRLGLK